MSTRKALQQGISLALVVWLLAGCASAATEPSPTPAPPPPPTETESPSAGLANPASVFCEEQGGQLEIRTEAGGEVGYCIFPDGSECEEWAYFRGECAPGGGDYQPLGTAECTELADSLAQGLGVGALISQAPFQDFANNKDGTGCQIMVSGTGLDFENLGVVESAVRKTIMGRGWYEDVRYGGGGAGGIMTGFGRPGGTLCLTIIAAEPAEDGLCPDDEPIFVCWENLTPEQKRFETVLNCARDTTAAPQPALEPTRIEFAQGETAAQVQGTLTANGAARYVLSAMAGQEMTVNLSVTSAIESPDMSLILNVWGADGAPLGSGFMGADAWPFQLPTTQDYYLDVISAVGESVDYTLEVNIPPVSG
jgi:putative hemolysin